MCGVCYILTALNTLHRWDTHSVDSWKRMWIFAVGYFVCSQSWGHTCNVTSSWFQVVGVFVGLSHQNTEKDCMSFLGIHTHHRLLKLLAWEAKTAETASEYVWLRNTHVNGVLVFLWGEGRGHDMSSSWRHFEPPVRLDILTHMAIMSPHLNTGEQMLLYHSSP